MFVPVKLNPLIASILISLVMLSSSLRVTITYAYYYFDPVGFIQELCENKDKPELQCNGKCQLTKVAQQSNDEKEIPKQVFEWKDITLYIVNPELYSLELPINNNGKIVFREKFYSYLDTSRIYHPPKL